VVVGAASTISQAQSLTTLHTFCPLGAPCSDGSNPDGSNPVWGGLVQGTDGAFYGTTQNGGKNSYGTVFKITSTGSPTTLYSFCKELNCTDGSNPYGGLVQGSDGNFYGTTSIGGAFSASPGSGYGTVFRITPTGTLTTIYSFQPNCSDGCNPFATLVQGADGNFYGTASQGGVSVFNTNAWGTVFRITPPPPDSSALGTLTTIYNFCSQPNCADGGTPGAPLVLGSDGNFYGTTSNAGANNQGGTVFKLTPPPPDSSALGTLTTLYSFCFQSGCTDGKSPTYSALVQASDGNFYGTTIDGGTNSNGTIFKVIPSGTSSGTYPSFYSFTCSQNNSCPNGRRPWAGLVQASDGNLYGTTTGGGNNGDFGTVFTITLNGTLTPLYSFCPQGGACTDGESPYSPVVEGADGNLYGTTWQGGNGYGTIFTLGLSAPAVTLSATSLNFGMQQIGGAYPNPQVQLTNSGTGPLTISSIQKTGNNLGDFNQNNNCPIPPNTLGAGSPCTFAISFTPSGLGTRSAAVSISDNAKGSPQSIALSGTAVDFSVSAVPGSNTIKGGKAATYNISVSPLGGNTLTASLSVAGCPANATCTVSPSRLALNGSTASGSTLTVKGSGKTKNGTYTLTINATVYAVMHSTAVSLIVQ